MNCHNARRLFGPYWDDETTQAERDWLESHFAGCSRCRTEYEALAHTLEAVASLPRHETTPDLVESTIARARRAAPMRDVLAEPRRAWVPVTAAAAMVVLATAVMLQFAPWHGGSRATNGTPAATVLRAGAPDRSAPLATPPVTSTVTPASPATAALADSVFDHTEDVEFVLDPVTLRRGRATVSRSAHVGIRAEQGVVSF